VAQNPWGIYFWLTLYSNYTEWPSFLMADVLNIYIVFFTLYFISHCILILGQSLEQTGLPGLSCICSFYLPCHFYVLQCAKLLIKLTLISALWLLGRQRNVTIHSASQRGHSMWYLKIISTSAFNLRRSDPSFVSFCLSNAIHCMGQNIISLAACVFLSVCVSVCGHGYLGSNISKTVRDRHSVPMDNQ